MRKTILSAAALAISASLVGAASAAVPAAPSAAALHAGAPAGVEKIAVRKHRKHVHRHKAKARHRAKKTY